MIEFGWIFGVGAVCAIWAYIYVTVLTDAGNILDWWYNWLSKKIGRARHPDYPCQHAEPIQWLWKPIIGCLHCVSGQLGLWVYLILKWDAYHWFEHLGVIGVSILTVDVIQRLWRAITAVQNRKKKAKRKAQRSKI